MARRLRIVLLWTTGALGLVLLLTGLGLVWLLRSESGQAFLSAQIIAQVSDPTGLQIEIGSLSGALSGEIVISDLVLSDPDGDWLQADAATLRWDPWALLNGRLEVREIRLAPATVTRPPALPEDPAAGETAFDLQSVLAPLTRLTVDSLSVEALTLAPGLTSLPDPLTLTAEGSLGQGDAGLPNVALGLSRLDGPPLSLDLQAGVTPDQAGLILTVQFTEPQGGAVSTLIGLPDAPALSLTLDGQGSPERWSGTVALSVQDWLRVDGPVTLQDLLQESPSFSTDLGAKAGAKAVAQAREAGVELDALAVTLSARGTAKTVAVETDVQISGLREGGLVPAQAFTVLGSEPSLSAAASLDLDANQLQLPSILLEGSAAQVSLSGDFDLSTLTLIDSSLALSTTDPALLAKLGVALGSTDPEGVFDLSLTSPSFALSPPAGRADLSLYGTGLGLGEPMVDALVGPSPLLTAALSLDETGTIGWQDLALLTDGLLLTSDGQLLPADSEETEPTLAMRLGLDLPDIAPLLPDASGGLGLTLALDGPLTRPDATADLVSSTLRLGADLPEVTDFQLRLTTQVDPSAPQGLLSLSGAVDGHPLSLETPVLVQPEPLHISLPGLALTAPGATLTGALDITPEAPLASGQLQARITDLGALGIDSTALFDPDGIALELTLTPDDQGRQDAGVALSAPQLGPLRRVTLQGNATDLLGTPALSARLDVGGSGPDLAPLALQSLSLTVEGLLENLETNLQLQARLDRDAPEPPLPLSLSAQSGIAALAETPALNLRSLAIEAGQPEQATRLSLAAPTTVTLGRAEGIRLTPSTLGVSAWDGQSGQILLSAQMTDTSRAMDIALERLPLSLAAPLSGDIPVLGWLEGRLAVSGPVQAPSGSLSLALRDIVGKKAQNRPVDLTVSGDISGTALTARAEVSNIGGNPVRAEARLPWQFDAAGIPAPDPSQSMSARLQWQGELAALWEALPLPDHRLSGPAMIDLAISGALADPQITGQATVGPVAYTNLEWGTELKDLTLSLTAPEDGTLLIAFSGNDSDKGTLSGQGVFDPADASGALALSADFAAKNAVVVRRDDIHAALSADIAVRSDPSGGLSVTGAVTSEGIEVNFADSLTGGLPPELEVLEVGGPGQPISVNQAITLQRQEEEAALLAAQAAEADGDDGGPLAIALDVGISLPGQVYVRGPGLESEWRGDLHVGGFADDPRITGDIQSVKGRADLLDRTFTLEPSFVRLDGGAEIDPRLDISVTHDAGDMEAQIAVGGTANHPEITLSSTPSLPEDEIISQVLFGRGTGRLSPFEALKLAQVAGQLSGEGGGVLSGLSLMDSLRQGLGLDTLRISGDGEDGAPRLEAGTYVDDGVYVGLNQGATAGQSEVTVEVDLTDSITLETQAGGTDGAAVGVLWEWDY